MGTHPCRPLFIKATRSLSFCNQSCRLFFLHRRSMKYSTFTSRGKSWIKVWRKYSYHINLFELNLLETVFSCVWLIHLLKLEVRGHQGSLSRAQPLLVHAEIPFTLTPVFQTTHSATRKTNTNRLLSRKVTERPGGSVTTRCHTRVIVLVWTVIPVCLRAADHMALARCRQGRNLKGLRIINSLKRGKEIIFTAMGAHRAQSPCGWWAMKIKPLREKFPSKLWYWINTFELQIYTAAFLVFLKLPLQIYYLIIHCPPPPICAHFYNGCTVYIDVNILLFTF